MRISDWSSDVCSSDLLSWVTTMAATPSPAETGTLAAPGISPPPYVPRPRPPSLPRHRIRWPRAHRSRHRHHQLGRATCRERVCQYVEISVVAVALQNIKHNQQ